MKILAIDSATKTGWAFLEDGAIIESGVQNFAKKRGESNGMLFMRFNSWMCKMLEYSPDMVAYERAHFRGGAATELCVGLQTRIQECAARCNVEYSAYATTSIKKFATGKGNAGKPMMMDYAREILGREPIDDNEADAVAIAMLAWEDIGI